MKLSKHLRPVMCLWFLAAILSAAGVCAAQSYTVTDLGTLGGYYSFAFGINANGQVAGHSETTIDPPFYNHAFLWGSVNGMQDLGTLGGNTSYASGINNLGQVVGSSTTSSGETHAFLWTPGGTDGVPGNPQMKDLGTLDGGSSSAQGINDAGQVVGYSGILYSYHAVLWDSDQSIQDIALGEAEGINSLGQLVGALATTGTNTDAFLWTPSQGVQDLGTLGGKFPFSRANGVNDNDPAQVVGGSSAPSRYHAFLYSSGTGMQDLGTLGGDAFSEAYGINNKGQVVGHSITLGEVESAVLWGSAGIHALNSLIPRDSGWRLQEARAINDLGQIVGSGYDDAGHHAFLLDPSDGSPR